MVTHDKYSFYNPKHHAMFDQQGGRRIFFEGTYSKTFSAAPQATARYDYNQIMYALDLGDERLALPVAVYERTVDGRRRLTTGGDGAGSRIAFMASDRPVTNGVAIGRRAMPEGSDEWTVMGAAEAAKAPDAVVFYGLPANMVKPPATSVALYAWTRREGAGQMLAVDDLPAREGYRRGERPLCRVWRYPLSPAIAWR